jgi:hypothetical protein
MTSTRGFLSGSVIWRTSFAICFIAYCSREPKPLSSRAIEALSREAPRSHLLREHCLRCLADGPQDINSSPFDQRRRELVVGRILGKQFAGEPEIRRHLENRMLLRPSVAIAGLSIAWKDSPRLASEYGAFRARGPNSRRYVWPDAAHLASVIGPHDEFLNFLFYFVERCTGNLWSFLPFCIEPIVERIKSEDRLASALVQRVKSTNSGNEKASLPKLLALANRMNDELRDWCERECAEQSNQTSLPEFGLDVSVGDIRPVAHALLEALSPVVP